MKYFSTFSGIGGFEIGIERAMDDWRNTKASTLEERRDKSLLNVSNGDGGRTDTTCVGYSEIDKYASSVYEYHFRGVKNYGDITKINAEELPDFDCLVGGFPCQAFSIAGKRAGFADTRGTLFFDLARILAAKKPRLFVFENVKGLLSHDNGQTFRTIIATIDELGYDCQWQVLNSKNHGVPQNRERVIIVGHLRGTPRPEVFPIGQNDGTHTREGESLTANTLTANYYKGPAASRPLIARPVITPDRLEKRQNGRRIKDNGEPAFTVTAQDRHGIYDGVSIRRLTPLECERLQGFPDNWTKWGLNWTLPQSREAISDTQRYKMCGNAVTTNVIQAVFERILTSNE